MNRLIKSIRRLWTESGVIPEDKIVPDTDTSAGETEEDYRVVVVEREMQDLFGSYQLPLPFCRNIDCGSVSPRPQAGWGIHLAGESVRNARGILAGSMAVDLLCHRRQRD